MIANSSTLQDNGTGRRTHLKVDWEWLDEWAKSDPYKELRERNAEISKSTEVEPISQDDISTLL